MTFLMYSMAARRNVDAITIDRAKSVSCTNRGRRFGRYIIERRMAVFC
jgi:hypothetical protein